MFFLEASIYIALCLLLGVGVFVVVSVHVLKCKIEIITTI